METKKTSVLKTLIFLTVTLMMTACQGKASMPAERAEGDTIVMRYARNLCLIQHADYTEAIIRNPWDTDVFDFAHTANCIFASQFLQ